MIRPGCCFVLAAIGCSLQGCDLGSFATMESQYKASSNTCEVTMTHKQTCENEDIAPDDERNKCFSIRYTVQCDSEEECHTFIGLACGWEGALVTKDLGSEEEPLTVEGEFCDKRMVFNGSFPNPKGDSSCGSMANGDWLQTPEAMCLGCNLARPAYEPTIVKLPSTTNTTTSTTTTPTR